ncbi:Ornithine decarboxylase 1 [Galdieria sulphuraria]|uniref:ornithine decarboxylase n=1 Tax=Galdieria sulphuraria TaxID=130081 RepID=M2Y2X1_GALSU|nr:ornithine decarboxylase [Galdieria sulphuraria]EME30288.1 ornithine decarboxylase [Galdieria sulphuraria]GJD08453.1 Ornithine decarboxylase 1 [Galdieria sulphuraria]|eukprot:XP_005706808.1 ornithine decarboxylase [Galdieria sulphuraria]
MKIVTSDCDHNLIQFPNTWLEEVSDFSEGSSVLSGAEQVVPCSFDASQIVKQDNFEPCTSAVTVVPVIPISPIVSRSPSPASRKSESNFDFNYNNEQNGKAVSGVELLKTSDIVDNLTNSLYHCAKPVFNAAAGTPIESVLSEFIQRGEESAFYLVDLGSIIMKYFEFVRQLPRIKPHYAVKCNPDERVILILAKLGCNFDCASKAEISLVNSCGVSSDRIIYANPCKPEKHLRYAIEHGVDWVTFDNKDELEKISRVSPKIRAVLRIATEDHDSLCPLSTKFGALPDEVTELLLLAKYLGVHVEGVAFHVGSGCRSVQTYIRALYQAREIFNLAESLGMEPFRLLDIGGGFPGYDGESPITFYNICCGIRDTIDSLFPIDQVKVIAEPGRYFVSSAFTLVTRIIARRFRTQIQEGGNSFLKAGFCLQEDISHSDLVADYYIDDGVYGSFRDVVSLGVAFYPKTFTCSNAAIDYSRFIRSCVFGPTCDSIDCIIRNYPLPILEVGDWLYFTNMGAYTVSLASSFNGFSCPSIKYVCAL